MNYDKKKYEIWDWKSPVVLHWIINPGLVINELILGQTIPKIMLIEREGNKPFYQRSLIPLFIYPFIKGKEITFESIVIGVPLWIIGGLAWGFTMKLWMNKIGKIN